MSEPQQQDVQPMYGYGPQYPVVYAIRPPYLGITIVSMCLGIASLTFGWLMAGLGVALGGGAVVCGHIGISQLARSTQPRSGKGFAIAGLVTGYAGILFGLIYISFLVGLAKAIEALFG